MKKRGIGLLVVLMIFSLAACSGNRRADSRTEPSQSASGSISSAVSGLPSEQNKSSEQNQPPATKSTVSSQLDDIYSTLEKLKGLTNSLDDVTSGDMSIPNL